MFNQPVARVYMGCVSEQYCPLGSVPGTTDSASALNTNGQVDHNILLMLSQTNWHNKIRTM